MTKYDLELETWYEERGNGTVVYFYGVDKDNWILFDPDNGYSDFIFEISDDGFEDNPPKIVLVDVAIVGEMFLEYGVNHINDRVKQIGIIKMMFKNIQIL